MNKVCRLILLLTLLSCSHILRGQSDYSKDYILVLHSINFKETWTHHTYDAIRTALTQDGILVKGEELQVPLIKDTIEITHKLDYLRRQYASPPEAVICIGDPAWLVVRPLFDQEWRDVPSLICNSQDLIPHNIEAMIDRRLGFREAMIPTSEMIKGYNVTTLRQPLYVRETIETIRKMQPELKKIAFICDNRYISVVTRNKVQNALNLHFPELKLEVLSWPKLSTEKLLDRLMTYDSKSTAIIYYSWYVISPKGENHYLVDKVQKMTSSFSSTPVYLIVDLDVKNGHFAGGHYISIEDFDESVVTTIREMIEKDKAFTPGSRTGGSPKTYLNYQHLYTHGIPPSYYPKNAIYFDEPLTFFEKNKAIIISGIIILFLLFFIITLRIRLLIQKRKMEEELREKEKIEEANLLKTAFLANMSHEIRTPLNAIVGFSNLIAQGEIPEEEREEFRKTIEVNNELLLQLINDILDLSKIEAGKMDFTYSDIDLSGIFIRLEQIFRSRTKPGVELICRLPEHSCIIHSEKNRLTQVVSNFLTNACKFTFKGSITMGYEEIGGGVRFYVSDTGKGIVKENIPHVFERFAKFDTFIQETGLGLSICWTIVDCLQGEIGVESEEGIGSTFWFTIPCEVKRE